MIQGSDNEALNLVLEVKFSDENTKPTVGFPIVKIDKTKMKTVQLQAKMLALEEDAALEALRSRQVDRHPNKGPADSKESIRSALVEVLDSLMEMTHYNLKKRYMDDSAAFLRHLLFERRTLRSNNVLKIRKIISRLPKASHQHKAKKSAKNASACDNLHKLYVEDSSSGFRKKFEEQDRIANLRVAESQQTVSKLRQKFVDLERSRSAIKAGYSIHKPKSQAEDQAQELENALTEVARLPQAVEEQFQTIEELEQLLMSTVSSNKKLVSGEVQSHRCMRLRWRLQTSTSEILQHSLL